MYQKPWADLGNSPMKSIAMQSKGVGMMGNSSNGALAGIHSIPYLLSGTLGKRCRTLLCPLIP